VPAVRLHDGAAKWATQAASRSRKRRPFGKPHLLDRGHHSTFVCCVDRLDEPDLPVVGSLRCERQVGRPWWRCLHHGARCTVYVAQPVGRSACDASSVRLAGLGQSSTVLWEDSAGFGFPGRGDGSAYTDGPQLLGRPVQCEPTEREGCNASTALSAHRLDTPLPHLRRDWALGHCSVYVELTLRCGHTGRTWLGRGGATNGSHKAGQPNVATIAMQQTHCNIVQQQIAT
jgi:hypothetical protein